jgi:hypothetical protein
MEPSLGKPDVTGNEVQRNDRIAAQKAVDSAQDFEPSKIVHILETMALKVLFKFLVRFGLIIIDDEPRYGVCANTHLAPPIQKRAVDVQ